MTDTLWRGVAIAEGFDTDEVVTLAKVVHSKTEVLEGEEGLGEFNFHFIEVPDDRIDAVVTAAKKTTKPSWYLHLVRNGTMHVVFRDKHFTVTADDAAAIAEVKTYAVDNGVHPEQIELERLFDKPYDDTEPAERES